MNNDKRLIPTPEHPIPIDTQQAIEELLRSKTVEVFDHTATEMAYNNGFEAGKKEAIKEIEELKKYVPPCKAGDTVWFDTYDSGVAVGIQPHKVIAVQHMICIKDDGDLFVTKINSRDFGVNTFLTKEEAETALEKMKGEKE